MPIPPPWEPGAPTALAIAEQDGYYDERTPFRKKKGAKPHSQSPERIAMRTEENLTPKMKVIRDKFIAEYVRDWNGEDAYIRAGGPESTAAKMAYQFLREPYVSRKIQEILENMSQAELLKSNTIIAGLIREANYKAIGASHGARVAAWAWLAKINGMLKEKVEFEGNVTHRGGVMIVPITPGSEEWEKLAVSSQRQLKEHAGE